MSASGDAQREAGAETTEALQYRCTRCDAMHVGIPAWHFDVPLQVLGVPMSEQRERVQLAGDGGVVVRPDGTRDHFVKGLLELPIIGVSDQLVYGVYILLSPDDFQRYEVLFHDRRRRAGDSFTGALSNAIRGYPPTFLLPATMRVREYPTRPAIVLESTDHPLAVDQREGISRERAIEASMQLLHPGGR